MVIVFVLLLVWLFAGGLLLRYSPVALLINKKIIGGAADIRASGVGETRLWIAVRVVVG